MALLQTPISLFPRVLLTNLREFGRFVGVSLWVALMPGCLFAGDLSEKDAFQLGRDFMKSRIAASTPLTDRVPARNVNLELAYVPDSGAYYIFNCEPEGYVIVAADRDLPSPVVAYSTEGKWNSENIHPGLQEMLDAFGSAVSDIKVHPRKSVPPSTADTEVSPLLGDIEWGQDDPYNLLCPVLDGGYRAASGCVNTAIGQIMKYYGWPKNPVGEIPPYTIDGVDVPSLNLDGREYNWDIILPVYDEQSPEDSRMAVAQLLHDLGIANGTRYGLESPASLNILHLCNNFIYDKSIGRLERVFCTRKYFEDVIRNSLDKGHPVYYTGGSKSGGHAFLCDGYDREGYFHFNFGWNGANNGYYLTSATGYDGNPEIHYDIKPDEGGGPKLMCHSTGDFLYKDGHFECDVRMWIVFYYGFYSDLTAALKVTDKKSGKSEYIDVKTEYGISIQVNEILTDGLEKFPDGDYRVSLSVRRNDLEYIDATYADRRQSYVDMKVSNGTLIFENNGIDDSMDDGKYFVDDIYYQPEEIGNMEVTCRNERGNSYSGDVVIPEIVEIDGKNFVVSSIGEKAFEKCVSLNKVMIGPFVGTVKFGAFEGASAKEVVFEREPGGGMIFDEFAFCGAHIEKVVLPDIMATTIRRYAFISAEIDRINIPNLVALNAECFDGAKIKEISVVWDKDEDIPVFENEERSPFTRMDLDSTVLSVPKGTSELYRSKLIWKDFDIRERTGDSVKTVQGEEKGFHIYDGNILMLEKTVRVYDASGVMEYVLQPNRQVKLLPGLHIIVDDEGVASKAIVTRR